MSCYYCYLLFTSSREASLLLRGRVWVRLRNGCVRLELHQTVADQLHNLGRHHHLYAGVELLVAQRLPIAAAVLLQLLGLADKVANQLERLPVRVRFALEASVNEFAEVVVTLAVNAKLQQTAALGPEVDGRRWTAEKRKCETFYRLQNWKMDLSIFFNK